MLAETLRLSFVAALLTAAAQAPAATLSTIVIDRDSEPVVNVVVYAVPAHPERHAATARRREPAVMDQRQEQFTPHILVTQTGGAVAFPNNDTVAHHVYSFSASKRFELPLYQGNAHPPVTFEQPGVVDIGCNIHDHMEAHIVVVDTPYFAMTDAGGRVKLTGLPDGEYAVQIYSPRLRPADHPQPLNTTISATNDPLLTIRLEEKLRPPHTTQGESLNWSRY